MDDPPEPMSLANHLLPRQRVSSITIIMLDGVSEHIEKAAMGCEIGEGRARRATRP
ncbi:hypothetical protein PT2222_480005 [Paraburkholderia tropica]